MNPIIRADGSPKFAMVSTLAGAIANIILDPLFIFVFRWGMMGAAVATVIGQLITAVLAVWYILHMKLSYDSELIQKIAEESGFTEGYVARREESAPAGSCPPPLPPGPLAPPMRTICGRSSGR